MKTLEVLEMSQKEFESKKTELFDKYHKCSSIPYSDDSKRWRHDFYSRNGRRMLTIFENK